MLLEDWKGDLPDCVVALTRQPSSWMPEDWLAVLGSMMFRDMLETFLRLMGTCSIDLTRFPKPIPGQTGLLHVLARHATREVSRRIDHGAGDDYTSLLWMAQIQSCVKAGATLHLMDEDDCTPFMIFLGGLCRHMLISCVHLWAEAMDRAGVDLIAYGNVELDAMAANTWYKDVLHDHGVIGMAYGAAAGSWHLWFRQPGDLYAGMFWTLIEQPQPVIPGGWPPEFQPATRSALEMWARCPRFRVFSLRRKAVRRLRAQIRRDAALGSVQVIDVRGSVQELQDCLEEFGRCMKRRGELPDQLLDRLRKCAAQLSLPAHYHEIPSCSRTLDLRNDLHGL